MNFALDLNFSTLTLRGVSDSLIFSLSGEKLKEAHKSAQERKKAQPRF